MGHVAKKCRCQRVFLAGDACPACGLRDGFEQVELSGKGTVYSFSRVHVPTPAYKDRAPYILALVDLDGGPRVTGQVEPAEGDALEVGSSVLLTRQEDGVPWFRLG